MALSKLKRHYQLPQVAKDAMPLKGQMEAFHAWATTPYQLDRVDYNAASSSTWLNHSNHVYLYMGFLHHYKDESRPTLAAFKDADKYASYLAFLLKKENAISAFTLQISTAKKVLSFLKTTASFEEGKHLDDVRAWLEQAKGQLTAGLPKRRLSVADLEADGSWEDAHMLVQLLDKFRTSVLERVPEEGLCIPHIARMLHDAALSSLMFGYMPTLRLSCLRSLKAPRPQPKCSDPDCKQPGRCKGNRLEYKLGSMWIALPHHKNQKRLDSEAIEVRLPNELEELLHVYIEKALPVLAGEGMDHMFMDLKGKPMLMASKMSFYWSGHLCQRLGISKVFPPNRLRHIFVDERRSRQRVEGPDDGGAALVMGNSEIRWSKSYDLRAMQRKSTHAVEAMGAWRAAMLAK